MLQPGAGLNIQLNSGVQSSWQIPHQAPGTSTGCSVIVWSYLHDVASLTGPVPAPGTTGSCAAECWCWCWRWQVYKFWVITQWSRPPPPSLPRPNHCVGTVETEILSKYTFQRHRTRWGLVRAGQLGGVWPGSGCRGCVTPAQAPASCPRINITTVLHCTVIHCTNTTARGQCYPLCCWIIKISVQATMSPLISAGLWAAVAGLGWAGLGWAGLGWACPGWDIYRVDKRVLSIFNCLWRCPVLRLTAAQASSPPLLQTKFIYWHVLLWPVSRRGQGPGGAGI